MPVVCPVAESHPVASPGPAKSPRKTKKNKQGRLSFFQSHFLLEIDSDTDPILAQTMLVSLPPSPNLLHLKNKRTAYFVPTFLSQMGRCVKKGLGRDRSVWANILDFAPLDLIPALIVGSWTG